MNVKRFPIYGAALASALALAACGSSSNSESPARSSPGGGETVSVQSVDGVGDVLVDADGKALYASDLEAGGKVKCVGRLLAPRHGRALGRGAVGGTGIR